ncbi:Bug family tripartite tricarboxylate transporter substrate binding protein [Polynucleobacter rarus]|uniref:Bug family tripartite tricarboxylate transporter substrate binding protein n=1 Tax=Polynucleobacter rarus TaxID=556055 RepID=UPI000D3E5C9F|nr:tripartite tricarboxylate transporter substrate binding protein [Polynucleobacter rarus]
MNLPCLGARVFKNFYICISSMLLMTTPFAQSSFQNYPNKPVKIVIPFAVGGPVDTIARILSQRLSTVTGQTVLVDNRGGGGGVIGPSIVTKANPDGYTILLSTGSMTSNPAFNADIPFDTIKDFTPVTMLARNYGQLFVVNPNMPVNSVSEFIQYAKTSTKGLNYGAAGIGNITYIAPEMMKTMTGIKMKDIEYKGTAPAITDLMGGHIDLCFVGTQNLLSLVQSGKLKALAITGPTRWNELPDVPTMHEAGVTGYELIGWFGVWLPAKAPPELVNRLYQEIVKALDDPQVKKQFEEAGLVSVLSSPDNFKKFTEKDLLAMKELAKKIGANPG